MAVEVGFEPTDGLHRHTLSRRARSATTRLHRGLAYWTGAFAPPCGAGRIPRRFGGLVPVLTGSTPHRSDGEREGAGTATDRQRCPAKNSVNSAVDSAARTPGMTSAREL